MAHAYNSGPSIKYANADQITVDLNADTNRYVAIHSFFIAASSLLLSNTLLVVFSINVFQKEFAVALGLLIFSLEYVLLCTTFPVSLSKKRRWCPHGFKMMLSEEAIKTSPMMIMVWERTGEMLHTSYHLEQI